MDLLKYTFQDVWPKDGFGKTPGLRTRLTTTSQKRVKDKKVYQTLFFSWIRRFFPGKDREV